MTLIRVENAEPMFIADTSCVSYVARCVFPDRPICRKACRAEADLRMEPWRFLSTSG
jgi:hypothetical protein